MAEQQNTKEDSTNSPRKWSDKLRGNEGYIAAPLEVVVLSGVLNFGYTDALKSLKDSGYHMRQALKTIDDAVKGGPEGMRAVESLDQALQYVAAASKENAKAAKTLNDYVTAKKDFAANLLNVYKENETIARTSSRVQLQVKGAFKNLFEFGNDIKPELFKEYIDKPLIVAYVKGFRFLGAKRYENLTDDQIVAKAIESSENLKKFYGEVKKFYDSRNMSEKAVADFCDYLENTKNSAEQQNKKLEEAFPMVVDMVKDGYKVEDHLFKEDSKGTEMTNKDLAVTKTKTDGYKREVTEVRSEVGQHVDLREEGFDYVALATAPMTLALGAVIVYKGITRSQPLKFLDNMLSKAICSPLSYLLKKFEGGTKQNDQ